MSFTNTYQKQVVEYGGGGAGAGGLLTITKNVVIGAQTKTYLDFEIPFGITQLDIVGNLVLSSTSGFPFLFIQFSSDGVNYTTPVSINAQMNNVSFLNQSLYTSTLGIFWYDSGSLIETLLQVPTTARLYVAKQATPTVPLTFVNLTSINIITTTFP